ncbi:MAG: hypothetical protein EA425_12520 [Puniceicoccaceae bacterium]|nr:MAG: hypothetical protein EA425_12520 [Puniceicoccaceae bacterium]
MDDFADSVTYYSADGALSSDAVYLTFGGMFIDDDFEDQSDVGVPSVNGLVFSVSSDKLVSLPGTVVSQN